VAPKKIRQVIVAAVALMTLGSGLINILSVLGRKFREHHSLLQDVFPLEFLHISRFLALLIGFALVVSSINIYKRKKRAFLLVTLLSLFSVVFHLTKGLDYQEAAFSMLLLIVLLFARKSFTVKSSIPELRWSLVRLVLALYIAVGYGILGFWLLDKRHFGLDFNIWASIRNTLAVLTLNKPADLVPLTRYARWFMHSLDLITLTTILYGLYVLFRPVLYRFRTLPNERARALAILDRYGRSSLDVFKAERDKSFFFSPSQNCFLAYRMGGHYAVVLADPVGPEEEIPGIIRAFRDLCDENDWKLVFHQTLPDFLPDYKEAGFKKLKIGDEAVVDLQNFSLEGKRNKHLRHYTNQFDKSAFRAVYHPAPVPEDVLRQVKDVSDDWLKIPGRRERTFTLGVFTVNSVRATPLLTALDPEGKIQAFLNIIRSYAPGETTIDLMRHRRTAPNGIMDYLFIKLFQQQQEAGFRRFSLGLAPMSGFQEHEKSSREERAVHIFLRRLNFLFSYSGLLQYKKKFATSWEPRYTIYHNVLDLPRLAVAVARVSELKGRRALEEEEEMVDAAT
jgi:phosphatidylglycerol lysyltransferase